MPSDTPRDQPTGDQVVALLRGPLDRLNFGCGPHPLPGWTNIDGGDGVWYDAPPAEGVIALDIWDALAALPDGVASRVYSEHVFEHFTLQQGHALLREWLRVLKPGGVIRIVCPDLEREARLLLGEIAPADDAVIDAHRAKWIGERCGLQPGERLTRAMVLNYAMWLDGHQFLYDAQTLEQSLALAGFVEARRETYGRSAHDDLCGIDRHDGGETGRSWIPSMALIMEATRPMTGPAPARLVRGSLPKVPAGRRGFAPEEFEAMRAHRDAAVSERDRLKARLVLAVAQRCAAHGWTRIALFGAGQHSARIIHEPWASCGVRVVAVLDDHPKAATLEGVPITTPAALREAVDAVVVSSDAHEEVLYRRASEVFKPRGVPVIRIYGDDRSLAAARL